MTDTLKNQEAKIKALELRLQQKKQAAANKARIEQLQKQLGPKKKGTTKK